MTRRVRRGNGRILPGSIYAGNAGFLSSRNKVSRKWFTCPLENNTVPVERQRYGRPQ